MANKISKHSEQGIPLRTRIIKLEVPLIVSVAFAFYAVRMFRLISRYAVNIFFSDQWDFNDATLFERRSLWQMFDAQHGPHRQGVGGLFEKMVDPLFRWNSRTESFIVGVVVVAAAICALWLKKRIYGNLSVSDAVIPAIFFVPGQWATWFNVANFAHGPFPLLLIVLYCASWTFGRRVIRYPLILFINFLSIYTGFGIFLGVLTPIMLLVDYWANAPEKRLPTVYFISALLVCFASLVSFFVRYRFWPASQCFSLQLQSPMSYLAFMAADVCEFLRTKRGRASHPGNRNRDRRRCITFDDSFYLVFIPPKNNWLGRGCVRQTFDRGVFDGIHVLVLRIYCLWKSVPGAKDRLSTSLCYLLGTSRTGCLFLPAIPSQCHSPKNPIKWLLNSSRRGVFLS